MIANKQTLAIFILFDNRNDYLSLNANDSFGIPTLRNCGIVVPGSAFQIPIRRSLRLLSLPIGSLHLIRYSFRVPFCKLHRHVANIDSTVQKWISLVG